MAGSVIPTKHINCLAGSDYKIHLARQHYYFQQMLATLRSSQEKQHKGEGLLISPQHLIHSSILLACYVTSLANKLFLSLYGTCALSQLQKKTGALRDNKGIIGIRGHCSDGSVITSVVGK